MEYAYYSTTVGIIWVVFIIYWVVSARSVKKDVYREGAWWQRIVIVAAIAIVLANIWPALQIPLFPHDRTTGVIAVILTAAGVAFAIWARRHLGTNWSGQPALKEGHEFVTSGPYRLVRHPIYTGIILAFCGAVLVNGAAWGVVLVVMVVMFMRRVYAEDALMAKQFPDQYPEYKKHTKALIPFVW